MPRVKRWRRTKWIFRFYDVVRKQSFSWLVPKSIDLTSYLSFYLFEVITFILISIMRIAHNNYYVYAIVSFRVEKSRLEKQLPIYVWYLFNAFVGKSSLLRIDIWIDNINWRLILERSIKCSFQVNRIIIVFS